MGSVKGFVCVHAPEDSSHSFKTISGTKRRGLFLKFSFCCRQRCTALLAVVSAKGNDALLIVGYALSSWGWNWSLRNPNGGKRPFSSDILRFVFSERPRRLLLSLGVPSRPSPGSDSGPFRSHPGSEGVPSRFALFYSISDPSSSRGGGHPGSSWSNHGPERSLADFLATSD